MQHSLHLWRVRVEDGVHLHWIALDVIRLVLGGVANRSGEDLHIAFDILFTFDHCLCKDID